VIDRNHNALANENEKLRAKEFLYEKFAFTGALWWDRVIAQRSLCDLSRCLV
jgi:hypothetical protein